jgi:hypothetical membrane protein
MSTPANTRTLLWAGPLAAILFIVGTTGLAFIDPGYSQLQQTISEIGSVGAPLRIPFAVLVGCVAVCELVLTIAVRRVAAQYQRSQATTYLVALSVIWSFGVAIFADPTPLHGVFGNLGVLAMLSPIVCACSWRREPRARALTLGSWILGFIVWAGIINFTPFVPKPVALQPYVGVMQRVFVYAWMAWLGFVGISLRELVPVAAG